MNAYLNVKYMDNGDIFWGEEGRTIQIKGNFQEKDRLIYEIYNIYYNII